MRMILTPNDAPVNTSASLWSDGGSAAFDLDLETEEQEEMFDAWFDDTLRNEGVDLGTLTLGQIRTEGKRRLHQFICETPSLWYLLPNWEIDRLLREREALLDEGREPSVSVP